MKSPIPAALTASALMLLCFSSGCRYNKADLLYPTPCDTSDYKFSTAIQPIFNANCDNCHGTGGLYSPELGDYNQIKDYIDNNPGGIENSINGTNNYNPMPKNASKMSDCNISKIQKWISAGAPNN